MRLDVLCPGSWQDSYESRMIGEELFDQEVGSFNDVMVLLTRYFNTERGKHEQELFYNFDLYLNCKNIGRYRNGEITIDPIIDMNKDCTGGYFRHGNQGFIINIENAFKYGLNNRSVRIDDTHVWR